MNDQDVKRKRVNLSLTEEAYCLLKVQARRKRTNASQMVEGWIWDEEELNGMFRISRAWVKDLDVQTLERLEDYCYENHTSPAEAVKRWVWAVKVKKTAMRGQLSFFK